jgi:hypothetical protein
MSTMRLPGFTAEASIYKMTEHYQTAGITIAFDAVGSIAPAALMAAPALTLRQRDDGGGASCFCPCCIISGGILWCC